jgi:hypothetical protein
VAGVWQREDEMAVCMQGVDGRRAIDMDRASGRERAVNRYAESGGDGGSTRWALVRCCGCAAHVCRLNRINLLIGYVYNSVRKCALASDRCGDAKWSIKTLFVPEVHLSSFDCESRRRRFAIPFAASPPLQITCPRTESQEVGTATRQRSTLLSVSQM